MRTTTVLEICSKTTEGSGLFGTTGKPQLSQIIDSLEHSVNATYELAAGESDTAVDMGDIAEARFVYIEADAEFEVSFGAGSAVAAAIGGAGGTYPSTFVGAEALALEVDGVAIAVVFDVADQSLNQIVTRINFAAASADAAFVSVPIAFNVDDQIVLRSPTVGLDSSVEVVSADALVLTALGVSVSSAQGDNAEPGTSNLAISRPADPTGASAAEGVKAYLLATAVAGNIKLTNPSTSSSVRLTVFVAGDLLTSG